MNQFKVPTHVKIALISRCLSGPVKRELTLTMSNQEFRYGGLLHHYLGQALREL